MGRADRISGIFWLCFAVLLIIQSYHLGLGTLHKPGPGFLFFWVNIVLGIMSLVVLIRAWVGKKGEGPQPAIFGTSKCFKDHFCLDLSLPLRPPHGDRGFHSGHFLLLHLSPGDH